jgi:peptide/nickel transport system permease protein
MQDTGIAAAPFRRNAELSLLQKMKRLRIRFMAWFGIVMLILFFLGAILADVVSPYDPLDQELTDVLEPPSFSPVERSGRTYILGSDDLGRDVLSRVLHGSRISLGIGFAAVVIGAVSGTAAGLMAGFYSGESGFRKYIDEVIMGLADIQLSMPSILVAIAIIGSLGPGLIKLTLVIALTGWVTYARTMRGQVLSIKETEYVTAAKAVGANTQIIMIRHILPNALSSLFVVATLDMARVILLEAGLSFLGLGVQAPRPSWGQMLSAATSLTTLERRPWIWMPPGAMIAITVLSINFIGDGLRDAFDPRTMLD